MDVKVTLLPYKRSFTLPKEWILSQLPGSILAVALDGDPDATNIDIPNTDVTPDVMLLLARLARGFEPEKHNPNVKLAHRYLNIPGLLYYADPLYDEIPDREDGGNPVNQDFIQGLLKGDDLYPYAYLVQKGYVPTQEDFQVAVDANSPNIVGYLLQQVKLIDPTINHNEALRNTAWRGNVDIVRLLLADPRVDPNDEPTIVPLGLSKKSALADAVLANEVDVVNLLLSDPRVDPNTGNGKAFESAVLKNDENMLRRFLAHPRTDPTVKDNWALKWAARFRYQPQLELLFADPRVQKSLSPNESASYQSQLAVRLPRW